MNEDYTLGLRYPKDNSNTPLNSFIDFTLPFLQTWMIPLAMNSGAINAAGATDKGKNPIFSYITIKEAMSDILVNRYDITKCTLKTKYKVYDVITYSVTHDSEGNKSTTETNRYTVDESSDGPMAEEYVNKSFEVNTKYCIKRAHTFDVKIDNEYTYNKYSDSDVENRINPKTESKEQGASYHEGGDPGGSGSYTYTVKDGHYINVTRTWEDEFKQGDVTLGEYTVDDVKEYVNKQSITANGMNNGLKTSVSQSSSGTIYNCKKYELTDEQIRNLAGLAVGEAGDDQEALEAVTSHMANLYEYKVYKNTPGWKNKDLFSAIYWRHSEGGWYDDRSFEKTPTEGAINAVKSTICEGKRTMPPYIDEFCTFSAQYVSPYYSDTSKYIIGETIVTQLFGGNPSGPVGAISGGNIYFCSDSGYKEYCESQYTTTGDGSNSTTTSSVKDLNNFLFLGDSLTYGLSHGHEGELEGAKFIGVIGSSATHWIQWMEGQKTKWDSNIDFTDINLPNESDINGVCIMLGFNALDGGNDAGSAANTMKTFLDKIKQRYQNKPIYVEAVLPCRSGSEVSNADATNEQIKKYNEEISSYCSQKGMLFIDTSNGYKGSDGKLAEDKSADGVHLKEYKTLASNIKSAILNSNVTNNPNNPAVDITGLEDFLYQDENYYSLLHVDKEINRVDMANAKPENYLQYMQKGNQYSNHVGYSRAYMAFGYDELKRLFRDKFGDYDTLPFVYGSSLGYKTYTAEYVMDAGTVTGGSSNSGGSLSITGAVEVPEGMGIYRTYTPWNNFNWGYGPGDLIKHLGGRSKQLSGNISKSSNNFILYGDWYAIAMVREFGGSQGNPLITLDTGDMVFIVQDDGTFYGGMIADTKVQWNATSYDSNPANQWGHDGGKSMIEFEMWGLNSAYNDPGNVDNRLKHKVTQVYKIGNAYDNPQYLNDLEGAAKSLGLDTSKLIKAN